MAKIQRFVFLLTAISIVVGMSLFVTSCKKDESPTGPTPITDDLFPLVAGRKINFTGYLRAPGADTNITATGAFYKSRWTIEAYNGATAPPVVSPGGVCTRIVDSVQVSPTPTWAVGALLIQKSVAVGAADFYYMNSLASFYRSFGMSRIDSLRWIKLTDINSGIGVEYSCYDSTYNVTISGAPTTARLQIVGVVNGRETLTLGGVTFTDTYKITVSRRVYLGGSSTASSTGITAILWIAPNVGPVKLQLASDDRNYGHYREFSSKNF